MNLKEAREAGIVTPILESMWGNRNQYRFNIDPDGALRAVTSISQISLFLVILGILFLGLAVISVMQVVLATISALIFAVSLIFFLSTKRKKYRSDLALIEDCIELIHTLKMYIVDISVNELHTSMQNALVEAAIKVIMFEEENPEWSHSTMGNLRHDGVRSVVENLLRVFSKFVNYSDDERTTIYSLAKTRLREKRLD